MSLWMLAVGGVVELFGGPGLSTIANSRSPTELNATPPDIEKGLPKSTVIKSVVTLWGDGLLL